MEFRKINLNELDKLKNLYDYENFEEFKQKITTDILDKVKDLYILEEDGKIIGEIKVTYKSDMPNQTIQNIRVYFVCFSNS